MTTVLTDGRLEVFGDLNLEMLSGGQDESPEDIDVLDELSAELETGLIAVKNNLMDKYRSRVPNLHIEVVT